MSKWTDGERDENFWFAAMNSRRGVILSIAVLLFLLWLLNYLPT